MNDAQWSVTQTLRTLFVNGPYATKTIITLSCLLFLLIGTSVGVAEAQTQRAEELKQNISDNQDEIQKLEAEIADYKIRLNNVGAQKKTLQSAIQTLDLTRAKLAKDTQLTQARITQTNATIMRLGGTIGEKKSQIEKNKKVIASTIKQLNELDTRGLLEIMLASDSISDFFIETNDLARLQSSLGDNIKSLNRLASELNAQKRSSEANGQKLVLLKSQLTDQRAVADVQRHDQATLLTETKNQESSYAKILVDREARKKQFEREISDFEAQLRAEIDLHSFPAPGTKVLAYPIDDAFITQRFGRTIDSVRLYTSGTHNGMDFRATPGTPIKAAGDGLVVGTGDTDRVCRGASYGRWVMIKHKNGLSTIYGHLELIKVTEGQQVKMGDTIGYSGATGYATGPHLHFGLFVSGVVQIVDLPSKTCPKAVFHIPVAPPKGYLDPQAYL